MDVHAQHFYNVKEGIYQAMGLKIVAKQIAVIVRPQIHLQAATSILSSSHLTLCKIHAIRECFL